MHPVGDLVAGVQPPGLPVPLGLSLELWGPQGCPVGPEVGVALDFVVFKAGTPSPSSYFLTFLLSSLLLSLSPLPTPGLSHLPLGLTRSLPSTSGQLAPRTRCARAVPGPGPR